MTRLLLQAAKLKPDAELCRPSHNTDHRWASCATSHTGVTRKKTVLGCGFLRDEALAGTDSAPEDAAIAETRTMKAAQEAIKSVTLTGVGPTQEEKDAILSTAREEVLTSRTHRGKTLAILDRDEPKAPAHMTVEPNPRYHSHAQPERDLWRSRSSGYGPRQWRGTGASGIQYQPESVRKRDPPPPEEKTEPVSAAPPPPAVPSSKKDATEPALAVNKVKVEKKMVYNTVAANPRSFEFNGFRTSFPRNGPDPNRAEADLPCRRDPHNPHLAHVKHSSAPVVLESKHGRSPWPVQHHSDIVVNGVYDHPDHPVHNPHTNPDHAFHDPAHPVHHPDHPVHNPDTNPEHPVHHHPQLARHRGHHMQHPGHPAHGHPNLGGSFGSGLVMSGDPRLLGRPVHF